MTPLQKLISETPSSKVSAAEIGFHVGAASRDAEVAELKESLRLACEIREGTGATMGEQRPAYWLQLIDEIESMRQQLDAFQYNREEAFRRHEATRQQLAERDKQVTLLRDGLKRADDLLTHSYDHVSPLIREALAATEPKP